MRINNKRSHSVTPPPGRKVEKVLPNGDKIIYPSIKSAAEELKTTVTILRPFIKAEKPYKGVLFRFPDLF